LPEGSDRVNIIMLARFLLDFVTGGFLFSEMHILPREEKINYRIRDKTKYTLGKSGECRIQLEYLGITLTEEEMQYDRAVDKVVKSGSSFRCFEIRSKFMCFEIIICGVKGRRGVNRV
jgi:hypothetical protein